MIILRIDNDSISLGSVKFMKLDPFGLTIGLGIMTSHYPAESIEEAEWMRDKIEALMITPQSDLEREVVVIR